MSILLNDSRRSNKLNGNPAGPNGSTNNNVGSISWRPASTSSKNPANTRSNSPCWTLIVNALCQDSSCNLCLQMLIIPTVLFDEQKLYGLSVSVERRNWSCCLTALSAMMGDPGFSALVSTGSCEPVE